MRCSSGSAWFSRVSAFDTTLIGWKHRIFFAQSSIITKTGQFEFQSRDRKKAVRSRARKPLPRGRGSVRLHHSPISVETTNPGIPFPPKSRYNTAHRRIGTGVGPATPNEP